MPIAKKLTAEQISRIKQADIVRPQRTALLISLYSGVIGSQLVNMTRDHLRHKDGILSIRAGQYKTFVIDQGAQQEIKIYVETIPSLNLFNFKENYYKTYLCRLSSALGFKINQSILQQTFYWLWTQKDGDLKTLSMMMGKDVTI
jgi:hypothetical protein